VTGLDGRRVYLDWNATAPLRPEARAAMLAAMDVVGNPSSVHAEGRAAKAIVEKARGQVAALVGCEPDEVVFTSGATEAAAMADEDHITVGSDAEHECVYASLLIWGRERGASRIEIQQDGRINRQLFAAAYRDNFGTQEPVTSVAVISAQSEIGVIESPTEIADIVERQTLNGASPARVICDAVQAIGRIPVDFRSSGAAHMLISGHKLGAPSGVGALITRSKEPGENYLRWGPKGSQERSRRAGTENVVGIAGFGAAAEAAQRDLEAGAWARVEKLRNILEERLAEAAPETIFFGRESARLPNTSCFAVPGWAGETQVMALDLAGFAVSAGSACSSGKVKKASRVLLAMGCDEITASSAIRVSMGPTTTEAEVMAFADAWEALYAKRRTRAARERRAGEPADETGAAAMGRA
jgi:cysteine desulfurase